MPYATWPTTVPTTTRPASIDNGCYDTVNRTHRLSIMDSDSGAVVAVALARHTIGGTVHASR